MRRIFINSYLAYRDDPTESLTDFIANFQDTITDPKDVNVGLVSLNFCPASPNIPAYENTIDISYNGTRQAYSVPSNAIYTGVDGTGPGTTLVEELNDGFKTAFSISYEPWSFSSDFVRLVFTPSGSDVAEIYYSTTTLARRIGMTVEQGGVQYTNASPFIATNQPILSRTQVIYLETDLTNGDSTTNGDTAQHNILLSIPITNPEYGSIITYSPSYDFGSLAGARTFSDVRFRILDDLFQPIQFTTNTNLLISLYVSYPDADEGYAGQLRNPTFGY